MATTSSGAQTGPGYSRMETDRLHTAAETTSSSRASCSASRVWVGVGIAAIVAAVVVVTIVVTGRPTDDCKWDKYRLPGWVEPTSYKVTWRPSMSSDGPLSGTVVLDADVAESGTGCVIMHSVGFSFSDVSLSWRRKDSPRDETATVKSSSITSNTATQQIGIPLGTRLAKGDTLRLTIPFSGSMSKTLNGMYISQGIDEDTGQPGPPVIVTQFEATYARKAFPCLDEPAFKARFSVVLEGIQSNLTALSNMPLRSRTDTPDGKSTVEYEESVPMSTYLLAVVVGNFTATFDTYHSPLDYNRTVEVSVWAPPGNENRLDFAVQAAKASLEKYEASFGVAFPLPEMKMAAIESFAAGAMENWGLVTYRLTALLADPAEASQSSLERVAVVVAHELAHQWFGNLVTTAFWNQLFLNEGFATLIEFLGTNASNPQFGVWDEFLGTDVHRAMRIDDLANVNPLVSPNVDSSGAIESQFNDIAYAKGGSVLRMLWKWMDGSPLTGGSAARAARDNDVNVTDSPFFLGLRAYLNEYKYSVATADQLFRAVATSSGYDDLAANMKTWSHQPGVPLVVFAWQGEGSADRTSGQLCVTQRRLFRSDYSRQLAGSTEFGNDQLYWVPMDLAVGAAGPSPARDVADALAREGGFSNASYTCFSHDTATTGFVKANRKSYGYYRVAYPPAVWALLRQAVEDSVRTDGEPVFGAQDRAGLFDDLLTVAETSADAPVAGDAAIRGGAALAAGTQFDTALSYMATLRAEPDYTVWQSALTHINRIAHALYPEAPPSSATGFPPPPSSAACLASFRNYTAAGVMREVVAALGNSWGSKSNLSAHLGRTLPPTASPESRSILARWHAQGSVDAAVRDAAIVSTASVIGVQTVVDRCNALWQGGLADIDPNYLGAVAATRVRTGGAVAWEEVKQLYQSTSEAYAKSTLLRALAASEDPAVLNDTLVYAMGDQVDQQDKTTLLAGVANNPVGKAVAWRFLTKPEVWSRLVELYGSGGFGWSRIITSMGSNFAGLEWVGTVKAFFDQADLDAGSDEAAQALEIIHSNHVLNGTLAGTGCEWLATHSG